MDKDGAERGEYGERRAIAGKAALGPPAVGGTRYPIAPRGEGPGPVAGGRGGRRVASGRHEPRKGDVKLVDIPDRDARLRFGDEGQVERPCEPLEAGPLAGLVEVDAGFALGADEKADGPGRSRG